MRSHTLLFWICINLIYKYNKYHETKNPKIQPNIPPNTPSQKTPKNNNHPMPHKKQPTPNPKQPHQHLQLNKILVIHTNWSIMDNYQTIIAE